MYSTESEVIDNLKSLKIENLNDEDNSKVILNLPEGWYAKELIYHKAPDFEFNTDKNKQIKKISSFEFYNSMKIVKLNQYGTKGLVGEFYTPSYYRDQLEISRFPNHSQVKDRVYSGRTILGQGEIFILAYDLPKEMRTDKYITCDVVYAWIPIDNESLAYNLSISVPLGEKDDDYIEMVKKMLNANDYTYINPNDIEWVTMQGGLHITTKVLFPGHDDEKISRIVALINSGESKAESTKTEVNVINSMARPIGILFKLKNGNEAYAWTDYTTKTFKDGWSATAIDDRFVLNTRNGKQDECFTIFSKDVAKYLRDGWKADMPIVNHVTIKSESLKDGNEVVLREGDKAVVLGDGCTAKQVIIRIIRNGDSKEDYVVGKVVPEFGKWDWKEAITRHFKTLDGKEVTLKKELYDINVDAEGSGTQFCGVIDFREQKKVGN